MEVIKKLPIELRKEIIKFDIHPLADIFKKEFKQSNETFANYYFHHYNTFIDEESFKIYYYDFDDNVYRNTFNEYKETHDYHQYGPYLF